MYLVNAFGTLLALKVVKRSAFSSFQLDTPNEA